MTPEQTSNDTGQVPPPPHYAPPPDDGTKILGILSIVFSFIISVVGLVIAIVGTSKAKQIRQETGQEAQGASLIKAGLICSIVLTTLGFLAILAFVLLSLLFFATISDYEYDPFDPYDSLFEDSSYEHIIIGKWDCSDTASDTRSPETPRRYEFYSSGKLYAYDPSSQEQNYLRGTYDTQFRTSEPDGHHSYRLSVNFSEFVGNGETYDEYIGTTTAWAVGVDIYDQDTIELQTDSSTPAYECSRVN